jgi:hypothetical protein
MLIGGNVFATHAPSIITAMKLDLPIWGTSVGAIIAFMCSCGCSRIQLRAAAIEWGRIQNTSLHGTFTDACRSFVEKLVVRFVPGTMFKHANPSLHIIAFNCNEMKPCVFSKARSPDISIACVINAAITNPLQQSPYILQNQFYCDVEFMIPIRIIELSIRPRCLAIIATIQNNNQWAMVHPAFKNMNIMCSFFDRIFDKHCSSNTLFIHDYNPYMTASALIIIVFAILLTRLNTFVK